LWCIIYLQPYDKLDYVYLLMANRKVSQLDPFTMKNKLTQWSKEELKIYILLLCAKADSIETDEQIDMIKSKIDTKSFDMLYKEFCGDDEDNCLEKIQSTIAKHEYSNREIDNLRKEIQEVFLSDNKFLMKERNLDRLLDSMLY